MHVLVHGSSLMIVIKEERRYREEEEEEEENGINLEKICRKDLSYTLKEENPRVYHSPLSRV